MVNPCGATYPKKLVTNCNNYVSTHYLLTYILSRSCAKFRDNSGDKSADRVSFYHSYLRTSLGVLDRLSPSLERTPSVVTPVVMLLCCLTL